MGVASPQDQMLALMISQIVAAPFSIPGSVNDVEPFQTACDHLFRCTPLRVHLPLRVRQRREEAPDARQRTPLRVHCRVPEEVRGEGYA